METAVFKTITQETVDMIRNGGLVAVPTETVYGLACCGLNETAVKKVYDVKGRPEIKPLSLMVPGAESMSAYCEEVPSDAKRLAEEFWPGPLTIVLKAKAIIPPIVLAGGSTVGLRCPDHDLTLSLLEKVGIPLAAPSANPSGAPSPKNAEKVLEYFSGKIDGVIDGGECGIGTESTIIDMSSTPYRILRQGALPKEDIEDVLIKDRTIVGITGGSGCGKTTALTVMRDMGALVLDCDAIYHRLLAENEKLLDEIESAFPGVMENGRLDRKKLGSRVFSDLEALNELNCITHKYIEIEIVRLLREFAMSGGKIAAIDAVELISSGISQLCDYTVAVISPKEKRIERIIERDKISREYATSRIEAQKPEEYFREHCGYTLLNDGTYEQFTGKCEKFFKEILRNG